MRCPKCGYFNLPGADQCGQCGQSLTAAASPAPVSFEEIYPPRARNRSLRERWESRGGRPARSLSRGVAAASARRQDAVQATRELVSQSVSAMPTREQLLNDLRIWGLASAAIIPGLGHILLGRYQRGFAFLGIGALLLLAGAFLRSAFADLFLFLLLGLM